MPRGLCVRYPELPTHMTGSARAPQATYDDLADIFDYLSITIVETPARASEDAADPLAPWRQCIALEDCTAGLQALLALVADWGVKVRGRRPPSHRTATLPNPNCRSGFFCRSSWATPSGRRS